MIVCFLLGAPPVHPSSLFTFSFFFYARSLLLLALIPPLRYDFGRLPRKVFFFFLRCVVREGQGEVLKLSLLSVFLISHSVVSDYLWFGPFFPQTALFFMTLRR